MKEPEVTDYFGWRRKDYYSFLAVSGPVSAFGLITLLVRNDATINKASAILLILVFFPLTLYMVWRLINFSKNR